MNKTVIIIPSRLTAVRLPNKPLLEIDNKPIIIHVLDRAKESKIGDVVVATPDKEIFDLVKKNSGKAFMTNQKHSTGTDRVYEALQKLSDDKINLIINLQGDMPNIKPKSILKLEKLIH
jgi:3-deoxy-manno-octulosonate cytidylyltransferase (CMP-KDO synthetase)